MLSSLRLFTARAPAPPPPKCKKKTPNQNNQNNIFVQTNVPPAIMASSGCFAHAWICVHPSAMEDEHCRWCSGTTCFVTYSVRSRARLIWNAPLYRAIQDGDLEFVKFLVGSYVDKEMVNRAGASLVHVASSYSRLEIVKYLVECGADKDRATWYGADWSGASPLLMACKYGHEEVVRYLLQCGADPERGTNVGIFPMYAASHQGHLEIVKCLVESGADKDRVTNSGASSVWIASSCGHVNVVKYLVQCGADKEAKVVSWVRGLHEITPLEMACRVGHLEVVKYLLGEGARCGPISEGVVQELLPRSRPEIATWLRSIIGWQPLHFACEADDEPMIMRLLRHGASQLAEANGITPNMLGSAATRRMVNEALVWKPSSHPLFPLSVRTVVRMVLLLRARCD